MKHIMNRPLAAGRALGCLLALALASCASAKSERGVETVFHTNKLEEIDKAINGAIAEKRLPGAVLWLERQGVAYVKAYGHRAVEPEVEPMTTNTVFDLASLTKVVSTAPSIMILVERNQVKLDAPVQDYIPEFRRDGKDTITIRQLLTHTSGLRSGLGRRVEGRNAAVFYACQEKTNTVPGTAFCYSDINFILLGEVVRRVSRAPLESFAMEEIYAPLKMRETGYLPTRKLLPRMAPTEGSLRGTVHDPTARGMGGVAGHAGVFGTAADLARFCRMMLNEGALDGARVMTPDTVRLMTSVQTPENIVSRRGLGWDIDTGYSRRGRVFPIGSYGHTGFTGTEIWIDPFSKTFIVFLSNRVHPDGHGDIRSLQNVIGTLAAEAVRDFDFTNVPGALASRTNTAPTVVSTNSSPAQSSAVLNGIDVLKKRQYAPLRGLRVGLITNHTGRDRDGRSTIDLLREAAGVELKALFSPEHGIRGQLDEKVGDSTDEQTGLPVYSLYGQRRSPTPEQLAGLDALVFDLQDIGCRFYTYISTLGNCLESASQARIKFIVLDRVNPINGTTVEGPVYQGETRFIAFHSLPLRHGMTVGELARMFIAERHCNVDLMVIPVEGWKRAEWFDQTSLGWTNPSPNMRSLSAATLYSGVGLLETAVSVGRGTDRPFEWIGAPYIDADKLTAEMNSAGLPGIRFKAAHFTPTASVFKDKPCHGVAFLITDRDRLQAVDVGVVLALNLQRLYPDDFELEKVNTLLLDPISVDAIRAGRTLTEIKGEWAQDLEKFKRRRSPFLIYP